MSSISVASVHNEWYTKVDKNKKGATLRFLYVEQVASEIMPGTRKNLELTELDNAILLLLKFAKKKGIGYLTQAQIQKSIYMLQVKSREYVGENFTEMKFIRQPRGPISVNVMKSLMKLAQLNYISTEVKEITKERKAFQHSLVREDFENVVSPNKALFALSTFQLLEKEYPKFMNGKNREIRLGSYETEPMRLITAKEKVRGGILKGEPLNLNTVRLNGNIVDILQSE